MTTTLSVITICYNCRDDLARTAQSIAIQRQRPYEWIIIDGASKDGTAELALEYANSEYAQRVTVLSEKDKGISDAFNKGIKIATGDYLLFLNAGDEFIFTGSTYLIHRAISRAKNSHSIVAMPVVAGDQRWPNPNKFTRTDTLDTTRLWIHHQGSFIASSLFRKYGLYASRYKIRMDFDFFSRMYGRERVLFFPVSVTRIDLTGISSRSPSKFAWEEFLIRVHNFGVVPALFWVPWIMARGIKHAVKRHLRK